MGDKIKVIMDCDPGIDDGIALAYAAAHRQFMRKNSTERQGLAIAYCRKQNQRLLLIMQCFLYVTF